MIYGVLMILVVYFLPEGIVPAVRNWWHARRTRRRRRRPARAQPSSPPHDGRSSSTVEGLSIRFGGLLAVEA